MPTPTVTIRISAAHHQILRDVAARLKADPGFGSLLGRLLRVDDAITRPSDDLSGQMIEVLADVRRIVAGGSGSAPAPVVVPVEPDIRARVEALEAAVAKLTPKLGRPRFSDAARVNAKAFREEIAAFAKSSGVTVAELSQRVATAQGITDKAAVKVLRGERPASIAVMNQIRAALGMKAV